jgi:glycine/D-amino acid oxidase-like deaminating enzyme
MGHFSYWEHKHFWKNWDFTVIGAGITGLTSAIFLKKRFPNASISVIERGILPQGASTKNAGFACFGSVSELLDDLQKNGEKSVFELVASRYNGLSLLKELLGEAKIDYQPCGGYEIFMDSEKHVYERCLGSLSYLNAEMVQVIGKQVFWDASNEIEATGMSGISNMLVNRDEGTIDTGLMMKNLAAKAREVGIDILYGVEVERIDYESVKPEIYTNHGQISPKQVILTTNGLSEKLIPKKDVRPARAQVLLTSPIENLKIKGCYHHDRGYNYFRAVDNRILLGGGRHLDIGGEETTEMATTLKIQEYLEEFLKAVILPDAEFSIEMRWSGIMGVGDTKEVIIDKIGPAAYRAVRLGGMGVALGSHVGKAVAEMVEH